MATRSTQHPRDSFVRGVLLPAEAASFLLRHQQVKRLAALPLLVNFALYALIIAGAIWLLTSWQPAPEWSFWGPAGAWLSAGVRWVFGGLKWIVGVPVVLILSYVTFTTVGMIIAAPFNEMLSERVERTICEPRTADDLSAARSTRAFLAGMVDAAVIVAREVGWTLVVLPLLLVPFIGAAPLFLVSSHFAALGFLDTAMARNHLRNRHKWPAVRERRWTILGLGSAMTLLFMVPFAGLFVMPLGVVGGTLLYCRHDWPATLERHGLSEPPAFQPPRLRMTPAATGHAPGD